MRTRSRSTILTQHTFAPTSFTELGYHCAGGPPYGGTTSHSGTVGFTPSYIDETMVDSLGKDKPHPVKHRKYTQECDVPMGSSRWAWAVGNGGGSVIEDFDNGRTNNVRAYSSYSHFQSWDGSSFPPEWVDDTAAYNEAGLINDLLQQAKQLKADVALNVIEAGQIVPSIRSLALSLPNMAKNWRSLRKVIRTASGGYLAWKFGVSPILSDVMSIVRYMPRIKDAVKRHERGQKSRFSRVIPMDVKITSSPYAAGYNYINGYPSYKWGWSGFAHKAPEIRYVLVVKPRSANGSALSKSIDFVTSRFSSSPASLAWELVPFSFVVDWFVDLRTALSRADAFIGYHPYEIYSFTKSVSYELETQAWLTGHSPCNGSTILDIVSKHRYKYYERSLVGSSPLATVNPRFGKSQAAISVALISQALSRIGAK